MAALRGAKACKNWKFNRFGSFFILQALRLFSKLQNPCRKALSTNFTQVFFLDFQPIPSIFLEESQCCHHHK